MFNKLKFYLNKFLPTHFNINVLVTSPILNHYMGYITDIPSKEELLFIFINNSDYEIININSIIKIGDVYHIDSCNGQYTIRIL